MTSSAPQSVSRLGDIWRMGDHRLLCGDSTRAGDVARLLGTARPLLMVTDPPWGVGYDPAWRNSKMLVNRVESKRVGTVLNDNRTDWRAAWMNFPGDVAYVWHGALSAAVVAQSLMAEKFQIRSQIVWVKPKIAFSRGHYHWQHETAFYAVRRSRTSHWTGDRKQSTVWQIDPANQDRDTVHATQKPVECMRRPILNNSRGGDGIFDPFLGSGTTLIAAEMTGRVCYGIEISPNYVDMAVARWQELTGQVAVLDETGRTFTETDAHAA